MNHQNSHSQDNSYFGIGWIAHNFANLLLTNNLLLVLGFGHSILTARLLGPDGKGIVFVIFLTTTSIGQVLNCSMGYSLQNYIGRQVLSKGAGLALSVVYSLAFGGGAALLIAIASDRALEVLSLDRSFTHLIFVALPIIPVSMVTESLLAIFISADMVGYRNMIQVGNNMLELLLLVLLVAIARRGPLGALESNLLSSLLSVVALFLLLISRYGFDVRGAFASANSVLGFGLKQHGATVLARAMKRADSYLLLYFLGNAQVGIYSVATALAELPMIVTRSLHGLVLASASANRRDSAAHVTAQISRIVAVTLMLILIMYAVLMAWALPVMYGSQFASAYWPFLILLVASFSLSFYTIIAGYLSGTGNPLHVTYLMSVSTVSNLAMSLVLIPALGLVGNALASSLSSLFTLWLSLRAFSKFSGYNYWGALLPDRSDMTRLRKLAALITTMARKGTFRSILRGD